MSAEQAYNARELALLATAAVATGYSIRCGFCGACLEIAGASRVELAVEAVDAGWSAGPERQPLCPGCELE